MLVMEKCSSMDLGKGHPSEACYKIEKCPIFLPSLWLQRNTKKDILLLTPQVFNEYPFLCAFNFFLKKLFMCVVCTPWCV